MNEGCCWWQMAHKSHSANGTVVLWPTHFCVLLKLKAGVSISLKAEVVASVLLLICSCLMVQTFIPIFPHGECEMVHVRLKGQI